MFATREDSHTQQTPLSLLDANSCLFPQVDYPSHHINILETQYTGKDICCSSRALSSHLGGAMWTQLTESPC